MNSPLLSVCLITYNHSEFIKQAVESVLLQKVNFAWELIIADDCSTDGTREIIKEYKEKYPDFIKLILQEKNVGVAQNFKDLIEFPKTKYIAYFEGDDYWTDPYKLHKQVDFLENNNECSIVFGNAIIKEAGVDDVLFYSKNKPPEKIDLQYYLYNSPAIPTCTVVLRNCCLPTPIPEWFWNVYKGDWTLWLFMLQKGIGAYIDDILGCYREHPAGISKSKNIIAWKKNSMFMLKNIRNYLHEKEYKKIIKDGISMGYTDLAVDYLQAKKVFLFLFYSLRVVEYSNLKPGLLKNYFKRVGKAIGQKILKHKR